MDTRDRHIALSVDFILTLIAFLLLSFVIVKTRGFFKPGWNIVFFVTFLILFISLFSASISPSISRKLIPALSWNYVERCLFTGVLFFIILRALSSPGIYMKVWWHVHFSKSIFIAAIIIFISYFEFSFIPRWFRRIRFPLMIGLVLLSRVFMVYASPRPTIDVWVMLQEGAQCLLQLENTYQKLFTGVYSSEPFNYYAYPPITIFLTTPFYFIFGDVRWTFIFAELVGAIFIFRLAVRSGLPLNVSKYLTLLFYCIPFMPFVIEQSWTEPLLVWSCILFIYFYQFHRVILSMIFLGVFFASKQYLILVIPLLLKLKFRFRYFWIPVLICMITYGIYLVWDAQSIIHDNVLFHFRSRFRPDALNLSAYLFNNWNIRIPGIVTIILMLFGLILGMLCVPKTTSGFFKAISIVFFITLVVNKHAFCNYYYFLASIIFLNLFFIVLELYKLNQALSRFEWVTMEWGSGHSNILR